MDDGEIFACVFGDDPGFSGGDGGGVDEVGADAEGVRTCTEEVGGIGERDAAGRHEVDVGEWAFERGQVGGTAEGARRKDLDGIGTGLPCGEDFGGGEGAGKDGGGVSVAGLDCFEIESVADDELGAFEDAGARCVGIENGAGAEEDVGAIAGEAANDFKGVGDGHRHFEDFHAAVRDGCGESEGDIDGVRAEDGDEADFAQDG